MIRIEVDRERCVGSGTCEMVAPDLFTVGDDGMVAVRQPEPVGDDATAAEEAVRACPTQALDLVDRHVGTTGPGQGVGAGMHGADEQQPHDGASGEQPEPTVTDVPGENRYEIREGDRVLGIAAYRRHGDITEFVHTEVDPDAGRPGVGSTLVRAALDDVRTHGGSVVPSCSFVRGWIDRHQEYADLVVGRES